jgi:ribosomal protein S3AE
MALEIAPILDRINKLVEKIEAAGGNTLLTAVNNSVTELQQIEALLTPLAVNVIDIENNVLSKLNRIKGTAAYSRTFGYYLTTDNVTSIVHTGTTALGVETVTETITYVNAGIGDFRVNTIIYS